jgi:hypothetical protein
MVVGRARSSRLWMAWRAQKGSKLTSLTTSSPQHEHHAYRAFACRALSLTTEQILHRYTAHTDYELTSTMHAPNVSGTNRIAVRILLAAMRHLNNAAGSPQMLAIKETQQVKTLM